MTLMDQEGRVLRSGRVPNLRAEIEKFLEGGEAMEAVLETGRSSYTMVEKLYEKSREAQFIRTIPGFGKYLSVLVAEERRRK